LRIGRFFNALLPHDPEFKGRRVVTIHNQRDFIFFRQHRYEFEDSENCKLQEIGPRFTLRLQKLQLGIYDTKFGEYEWFHNKLMDDSRRRFHL
jgi:ribosome production factor 1